jgi:hypothetical protein
MQSILRTKNDLNDFAQQFWKNTDNKKPCIFGIGKGFYHPETNKLIAVKWLTINNKENLGTAAVLLDSIGENGADIIKRYFSAFINDEESHNNIEALKFLDQECPVLLFYNNETDLTEKSPFSIPDIHFRYALVSKKIYLPNALNTKGQFDLLPVLTWCTTQPFPVEYYNENWHKLQSEGEYPIGGIGFFPPTAMMKFIPNKNS